MKYNVRVTWEKNSAEKFTDLKYHRLHKWIFDGGDELKASSSPHSVPLPYSDESAADPEEAFIASVSSCHMLFFLSIAAAQKFTIESYLDDAEGFMERIDNGEMALTRIILKPKIVFSGPDIPDSSQIDKIHQSAHKKCYIANSIKSEIVIIQN
jgi:organic hydroperoxide reductase OsmC/OhrA